MMNKPQKSEDSVRCSGLNPCQQELAGNGDAGVQRHSRIVRSARRGLKPGGERCNPAAGSPRGETSGSERGKTKNRTLKTSSGFTFVELVVALGIGAMVIAVSIMAYGTINSQGASKRQVNVNIGINNAFSFYGWTDPQTAVSEAPSFAAAAMANNLREQFLSDISSASAVVCLARNLPNISALRPTSLAISTNIDPRSLVSPDNFRTNLIDPSGVVYTNFSTNAPLNGTTAATNLSVYILNAGTNSTNITVDAIYESDWVAVTNAPLGVYASVRRYVGTNMTSYYHVFYPQGDSHATNSDAGLAFTPIQRPLDLPCAAYFSRSNTTSTNVFSKAENRPFYLVWWPDPMNRTILPQAPYSGQANKILNPAIASDYYTLQFGSSSYFFVVPAYPPL